MNTGDKGEYVYTINRIDGNDLVPIRPIKYYKTMSSAVKKVKELQNN